MVLGWFAGVNCLNQDDQDERIKRIKEVLPLNLRVILSASEETC